MASTFTHRIDGLLAGVSMKAPCRVATTEEITLEGLQTVDGVSLSTNDRVLVKDQSDTTENGIYLANTSEWQRALDFNGARDAVQGTFVSVYEGGDNGKLIYRLTTSDPKIGTSNLTFELANTALNNAGGEADQFPKNSNLNGGDSVALNRNGGAILETANLEQNDGTILETNKLTQNGGTIPEVDQAVVLGSPSGGAQGSGTINAEKVYEGGRRVPVIREEVVGLGGDYLAGAEVRCVRIGNVVTITATDALFHSEDASPESASGVIPEAFRPTSGTVSSVYYFHPDYLAKVDIQPGGRFLVEYCEWDGTPFERTAAPNVPTATFNIDPDA